MTPEQPLVTRVLQARGAWRCKHCRRPVPPGQVECEACHENTLDERHEDPVEEPVR